MKRRNMNLIRRHYIKYWHGRQKDGNLGDNNNLKERFIKIAVSCGCKGLDDYNNAGDRSNKEAGPGLFIAKGLRLPPERGDPWIETS